MRDKEDEGRELTGQTRVGRRGRAGDVSRVLKCASCVYACLHYVMIAVFVFVCAELLSYYCARGRVQSAVGTGLNNNILMLLRCEV